jgi:hypothetical protein
VVCNEKRGGLEWHQLVALSMGYWRSRLVLVFNFAASFVNVFPPSTDELLGDWHVNGAVSRNDSRVKKDSLD